MHKDLRIALVVAILVSAAALFLVVPMQAAPADDSVPAPQATPASLYPSPNERIGVGVVSGIGEITHYDVAQLGAGWYSDWGYRLYQAHPNGMDHYPLIPTGPGNYPPEPWDYLTQRVLTNLGATWLVGNEPEAPFQENRTPAEYAVIYHDVYTLIKSVDPTAQVAIAGVILPSPLRLQWLDRVLQEYQTRYGVPMQVDVWNTHMQIVNEVSCNYDPGNCWGAEIPAGITADYGITMSLPDNANVDLFVRLVRDMRTWMNERGFRNKPLIISEYGVLLPSEYLCEGCGEKPELGDAIVASYMTRTFEYLLTAVDPQIGYPADGNRLVQRWMWYSLNERPYNMDTGEGFNGGLFDWRNPVYPGTLTYFGQVFKNYVPRLKTPYIDVKPTGAGSRVVSGETYTITAQVVNMGNIGVSTVKVRLYDGDPASGGVQVGSDATVSSLGIRYTTPGTAAFFAPPEGTMMQTFYVVVDPDNEIAESNKANNTASFTVRLRDFDQRIYLPVISKDFQFAAH